MNLQEFKDLKELVQAWHTEYDTVHVEDSYRVSLLEEDFIENHINTQENKT